MKKRQFSIKNFILKGITNMSVLIWCMAACLLDSGCWHVCLLVMLICLIWIALFVYANYCWRIENEQ